MSSGEKGNISKKSNKYFFQVFNNWEICDEDYRRISLLCANLRYAANFHNFTIEVAFNDYLLGQKRHFGLHYWCLEFQKAYYEMFLSYFMS